jgi:plastocyanin
MARFRARVLAAVITAAVAASMVLVSAPAAGAAPKAVAIKNAKFKPRMVTIDKGQSVKWTNKGTLIHNVRKVGGGWGSTNLDPGEAFQRKFNAKGTVAYRCTIHGFQGTVIVE